MKRQSIFLERQGKLYNTYHTSHLRNAQNGLARRHGTKIRATLKQINEILSAKGVDYNNLSTFSEHMPFGDKSWATLLWIKAHRVASVVHAGTSKHETLDDSILDLATYTVAYFAWRQLKHDETASMRNSTDQDESASIPSKPAVSTLARPPRPSES